MRRQTIKARPSGRKTKPRPKFTRVIPAAAGVATPGSIRELKFLDSSPSNDPPFASSAFNSVALLNACIAGPLATNRVGRKIKMENLFIRWTFNMAATSTGGSPFRILIVYDRQTNITAPAITDILLADDFSSPMNLSNRDRFVIIMDKLTQPIGTVITPAISGKKFINLRGLEVMYNTTEGGTVADITTGGVFIFVAQTGAIGTAAPNFFARVRIKFSDL